MSSPHQSENRPLACKDVQGNCQWLPVIASVSRKDMNYQGGGVEWTENEGPLSMVSSKTGYDFKKCE